MSSCSCTLVDCEIDHRLAWKIFRHCVSGLFKQIKSTIHAQRFLHHVTHMDVEHWHPVEVSGHDDGDFIADGLRDHSCALFVGQAGRPLATLHFSKKLLFCLTFGDFIADGYGGLRYHHRFAMPFLLDRPLATLEIYVKIASFVLISVHGSGMHQYMYRMWLRGEAKRLHSITAGEGSLEI